jgi:DNA-binding CsgD family transcriptional regulator
MRLGNIANFLATEPDLDLAIQYVGLNACQHGFICRIYISSIDRDLNLTHLSSFGYDSEFLEKNNSFSLLTNPLLNQAAHSESLMIVQRDKEFFARFSDLTTSENEMKWKTTIFLPLLPSFAATISTQVAVEDNDESRDYFGILQAILNLYLRLSQKNQVDIYPAKNLRTPSDADHLTVRQEEILDHIKSGLTNGAIARRMGYSESLIRQETIVIYRKMGVDGRRELVRKHLFDQSGQN